MFAKLCQDLAPATEISASESGRAVTLADRLSEVMCVMTDGAGS